MSTLSEVLVDHKAVFNMDVSYDNPVGCSCGEFSVDSADGGTDLDGAEQFALHLEHKVLAFVFGRPPVVAALEPAATTEASIQVQVCTSQNMGDHASDVRLPRAVEPGETVVQLVARLFNHPGAGEKSYMPALGETDWIELRWIGDPPAAAPTDPFASPPF